MATLASPRAASSAASASSLDASVTSWTARRARDVVRVARDHVDHEIPERLAEPDHGHGRDRVQDQLLSGAGLQARRAGDHLGPDDGDDLGLDRASSSESGAQTTPIVRASTAAARASGAEDVGRRAARRDRDDGIGRTHVRCGEVCSDRLEVVLRRLFGHRDRDDDPGRGQMSAGTPRRPSPQAARRCRRRRTRAARRARGGRRSRRSRAVSGPAASADRAGNGRVLAVHQVDEVSRRPQVQVGVLLHATLRDRLDSRVHGTSLVPVPGPDKQLVLTTSGPADTMRSRVDGMTTPQRTTKQKPDARAGDRPHRARRRRRCAPL